MYVKRNKCIKMHGAGDRSPAPCRVMLQKRDSAHYPLASFLTNKVWGVVRLVGRLD